MLLLNVDISHYFYVLLMLIYGYFYVLQIHSLNVLRALFRDTRLADEVMSYVADGLKAAIVGYTSDNWAVRVDDKVILLCVSCFCCD